MSNLARNVYLAEIAISFMYLASLHTRSRKMVNQLQDVRVRDGPLACLREITKLEQTVLLPNDSVKQRKGRMILIANYLCKPWPSLSLATHLQKNIYALMVYYTCSSISVLN